MLAHELGDKIVCTAVLAPRLLGRLLGSQSEERHEAVGKIDDCLHGVPRMVSLCGGRPYKPLVRALGIL